MTQRGVRMKKECCENCKWGLRGVCLIPMYTAGDYYPNHSFPAEHWCDLFDAKAEDSSGPGQTPKAAEKRS